PRRAREPKDGAVDPEESLRDVEAALPGPEPRADRDDPLASAPDAVDSVHVRHGAGEEKDVARPGYAVDPHADEASVADRVDAGGLLRCALPEHDYDLGPGPVVDAGERSDVRRRRGSTVAGRGAGAVIVPRAVRTTSRRQCRGLARSKRIWTESAIPSPS